MNNGRFKVGNHARRESAEKSVHGTVRPLYPHAFGKCDDCGATLMTWLDRQLHRCTPQALPTSLALDPGGES